MISVTLFGRRKGEAAFVLKETFHATLESVVRAHSSGCVLDGWGPEVTTDN